MGITPGEEPGPVEEQPLLAEEPLPPGSELAEKVEELDERIRQAGPEEVREADEEADAVEGDADDDTRTRDADAGSDADSDADPTSDEGADPEDPEAQHG
ncbi:hypothetical protein [Ornithinimicrobium sufpigmenti]|uniref:hypothetical protein n=1 Tax=Ornithinimicrobium sufpigmenti TaxID=2508882 RepID=UPI001035B74B|nr:MULTISPECIES: hypothetical protein [unclassified Ornithinimicrobium]